MSLIRSTSRILQRSQTSIGDPKPESTPDVFIPPAALRRRKRSLSTSHLFPHGVTSLSGESRPDLCIIAAKKVKTVSIKVVPAGIDLCLVIPMDFHYFVTDIERLIRSSMV